MEKVEGHVHLQHMVMLMALFTPMIIPPNFFVIWCWSWKLLFTLLSLGAESPNTIRPLVAALTFHQFFEGMGLGSCISQILYPFMNFLGELNDVSGTTCCWVGKFQENIYVRVPTMGIGIGMVTNVYDENSPTTLIVEGVFNAALAGILIYMALVDLLATGFMNPRMQQNGIDQCFSYTGFMSLIAK